MIDEKDLSHPKNYRAVKEPTEGVKEHYANYFKRNQTKFMRRSKLEESHLGSEFEFDGKTFKLLGSVDPVLMFVVDINENKYYFLHCDVVTEQILNKQ